MGNGNGRGDLLYALVDDVSELRARVSKYDEDMAAIRTDLRWLRQGFSDLTAIVQAIADKLVSMDAKLDNHDRRLTRIEEEHGYRLDRIEARLDNHDRRFDRIEARLDEHGQHLVRIEDLLTKKGWKH